MSKNWTAEEMPSQAGKVVLVTGANSGIGLEAAREFARKGATVILGCRSLERGQGALDSIESDVPEAKLDLRQLDLADLDSVRRFAEEVLENYERLDVHCNNAGLMAIPRRETAQGFEMQFGVNHLGHFALTGRLMPLIEKTAEARVVTVSSNAHLFGTIRFEDLQWEKRYSKWGAYGQSKLANLLFAYELQRRFENAGIKAKSIACHPGLSHSELAKKGPAMTGNKLMKALSGKFTEVFGMSAEEGALPTLYAATYPELEGGEYVGPDGPREVWGAPKVTRSNKKSYNDDDARRLWQLSESLTEVYFL